MWLDKLDENKKVKEALKKDAFWWLDIQIFWLCHIFFDARTKFDSDTIRLLFKTKLSQGRGLIWHGQSGPVALAVYDGREHARRERKRCIKKTK